MSLDVGAALRDGFERTIARSGLALIAVFAVIRLATAVTTDTVNRVNLQLVEEYGTPLPPIFEELVAGTSTPFALPLGYGGAIGLVLLVALLAEAVRIVGVRTLVSDETETIPAEYVRRNIGIATLNGFVGGIVVFVLVGVGTVLLVLPGLFLAVSFFFVRQVIAVEDENFVAALAESWRLTSGNRLALFVLAAVVVVIAFLVSIAGGLVAPTPVGARVIDAGIGAGTAVFGMAVAARAYVQLRDADEEEDLTHWDELDS